MPVRRMVRGALLAAGAVTGLLLVLMLFSPSLANVLLFHPDPSDPGDPPTLATGSAGPGGVTGDEDPADDTVDAGTADGTGVEGETVHLTASDGVDLKAWWYPLEEDHGVVVVFHGNAGHLGHRTQLAEGLLEEGFSVLLAPYRGYGGSEGRPTEAGVYRDGQAAYAFAARQAGGAERVAFLGRSLGGSVAMGVADGAGRDSEEAGGEPPSDAPPPEPPGALILDSAFTSLGAIGQAVYPILPSFVFRRLEGSFPTLERTARFEKSLLVVHGERDGLVPPAMGRDLYDAAPGPKEWLQVDGGGHNDLLTVAGPEYFRTVGDFLRRHLEE